MNNYFINLKIATDLLEAIFSTKNIVGNRSYFFPFHRSSPALKQDWAIARFLPKPAASEMTGNDPHFVQTLLCPSLFKKFAKEMGRNSFYYTLKHLIINSQ